MGSKINPGQFDCYAAALLDEPMFILLARDQSAPEMLRQWAYKRRKHWNSKILDHPTILTRSEADLPPDQLAMRREYFEDMRKCTEADQCADQMAAWRKANDGAWRDSSQQRLPLEPLKESLGEAIAEEARRAVANICMIGSAQITLEERRINDWSMPGFGIRRHYFRFSSNEQFERLRGQINPVLPDFRVSGHDVVLGDVLCRHKSDSDVRLELQVLEL